jgi:hypothetical protein
MSLRGKGALAIWHDLVADAEPDFIEWHNREHIPERLGVPGFLRGRRCRAVAGGPRWFMLYEVESLAVLTSDAYLARLNDPTPWTRRQMPAFHNTARSICTVEATAGVALGGHVLTLRLEAQPGREAALRDWLTAECLPAANAAPGVVGAHLCVADRAASTVETAEKRGRAEPDRVPGAVVLIEGSSHEALAEVGRPLNAEPWADRGATAAESAIYQLDVLLARA